MKFSEINFEEIIEKGFDKLLIMRNGNLLVGGKIQNVLQHKEILGNKLVANQAADGDIWIIEVLDQ